MSEIGFEKLTQALSKELPGLEELSNISVSLTMLQAAETILKKSMELDPYRKAFESQDEESPEIKALNKFFELALPLAHKGEELNVLELAKEAGVDPALAENVWKEMLAHTARIRKGI
jgi:hypothetical protein